VITRLPLIISEEINPTKNSTIVYNNNTIVETNSERNRIIGISTGLLSTVFISFNYVLLRRARSAEPAVALFNQGWVALIEVSVITFILKGYSLPTKSIQWLLIVLLFIFGYSGNYLLTKSLRLEQCSPIAVIRATVDILLGYIWQISLFKDDKLDAWAISGGLLVTSCIILTTFRKYINSLPDNSKVKMKFNFMTK
jgi:drug/metabolite transporter (DMT)-like permease